MDSRLLAGLRLLVVEDDAMLAMALDLTLSNLGCDVVGVASSLGEAVPLACEAAIDGAILDVNLAGEKVYPVADILAARKIPFVFTTGYGRACLRDRDRARPVLQKPYDPEALAKIAEQWCNRAAGRRP